MNALKEELYQTQEMIITLRTYFVMASSKREPDESFHLAVCKQVLGDIESSLLGASALRIALNNYLHQRSLVRSFFFSLLICS